MQNYYAFYIYGPYVLKKLVNTDCRTYLCHCVPYIRITILLSDGGHRSGVRKFPESTNLEEIRSHAWKLAAEALGRNTIADVTVAEVPADDPAVVTLILGEQNRSNHIRSDGTHPYRIQQGRKPSR